MQIIMSGYAKISIHALLAESDHRCFNASQNHFAFLSTLSLRRATIFPPVDTSSVSISIHALLAESDPAKSESLTTYLISIHALLAESDEHTNNGSNANLDFYPRSPCGERPTYRILRAKLSPISIHALLAESDPPVRDIIQWEGIFLSTLSLRRAT